ncbi:hypothetical protein DSO57_1027310 [Entomophthora muscae]|uniref:Uncharacterized protein n=1 Tax=Entomophthora muscae TaxID=34485 RepID=A0ACC2S3I4_9FUNG|nr:hypothetical protein DSO57_1027310 [Entomophthora muscae]
MRSMLLKSCQRKLTQKVSIRSGDAFNNLQYTLALLKPDLFTQPHCVKAVLNEFIPMNGLKIVIQKTVSWSVKDAQYFYAEHRGKYFFQRLTDYLSSGPFFALVLQGPDAISKWRKLIGPTRPDKARIHHPETLRAHFGLTDTRNSFHGSGKRGFFVY